MQVKSCACGCVPFMRGRPKEVEGQYAILEATTLNLEEAVPRADSAATFITD